MGNQLSKITIPNSVNRIEGGAFSLNPLVEITIGENVQIALNTFEYAVELGPDLPILFMRDISFIEKYNNNGMIAGTYTRPDIYSTAWTRQ